MFRVGIVGRPNVGKSTLFNRIIGSRRAIVGDEPGITRDRIYARASWRGRTFEVIDTGGILVGVREAIPAKILEQVGQAIDEADLLLLVVDGRAGSTPLDEQLLPMLRREGRPIWVAVNKIDTAGQEALAAPFHAYGMEEVFALSAEHNQGVADLLDRIVQLVPDPALAPGPESLEEISLAVVGRPNVGKSSLVNRLLGVERAIVSEFPGTTRDAVDSRIVREGTPFRIIDTAGIRRKGKSEGRTEKVSVVVARAHMARADVALLLIDASEGVTKLDAAIGGYASEAGCSVIIVLNKWDLVEKRLHDLPDFTAEVRRRMKYLAYAPVVAVSATSGRRVASLFDVVSRAREARFLRIPTGMLNHMFVPDLDAGLKAHHPDRSLEIRYITQAEVNPPTFVVFTTGSRPLHFSTERFLQNRLREKFGFFATPIRIRQKLKPKRGRGRAQGRSGTARG